MRITRETLLKIARETAETRGRRSRGVVSIFLTGSLLNEPLLGGTTDIDLVVVHSSEPAMEREIVSLGEEVHLDITHYSADRFAPPRRLRTDPVLGPLLCADPIVLYDNNHWFEFVQASVCAQFMQPENVIARARPSAEAARAGWLRLHTAPISPAGQPDDTPERVARFLGTLQASGDALALLYGTPLPLRRFFLILPGRAASLNRPGLASGLADLLGSPNATPWDQVWPSWEADLAKAAALPEPPPALHPARIQYHTRAARAMHDDEPVSALWLVLNTWTAAVMALGQPGAAYASFVQALGLSGEHFSQRMAQLDAYLDGLEEALDAWASQYGVGM